MENRFAVASIQVWEAGFSKVTAQGFVLFFFFEVIELFCILILVEVTQAYLVLKLIDLYIKTIAKYVNFFLKFKTMHANLKKKREMYI